MNFLEKDLENYLFAEPLAAYFDGFDAFSAFAFDDPVQRFPQLQLGPYGIADLVQISYPRSNRILVQVFEYKRGAITLLAYAQAKRYLAAVKHILRDLFTRLANGGYHISFECVLVGDRVDTVSDLVFVLNEDDACRAYTYFIKDYRLKFDRVGKGWQYNNATSFSVAQALVQRVDSYVAEAMRMIDDAILESIEQDRDLGQYGA